MIWVILHMCNITFFLFIQNKIYQKQSIKHIIKICFYEKDKITIQNKFKY